MTRSAGRGLPVGAVVVYGALSAVALGTAFVRGQSPFVTEAWFPMGSSVALTLSLVLGSVLAWATIASTRYFVRRWHWARSLHSDLRPAIEDASERTIVFLGLTSAFGEELFFRGLLATSVGIVASSIAFGLLHQVRGRARWIWAGWATIMGFAFGAIFLATGNLAGALAAHAAINISNLRFLRDTEVEVPKSRHLGGILGRN